MSREQLLISATEAADILGIGRSLFYELQQSGRLGPMAVRLGKRCLWNRSELARWVEAGCPGRERWQLERQGVNHG